MQVLSNLSDAILGAALVPCSEDLAEASIPWHKFAELKSGLHPASKSGQNSQCCLPGPMHGASWQSVAASAYERSTAPKAASHTQSPFSAAWTPLRGQNPSGGPLKGVVTVRKGVHA